MKLQGKVALVTGATKGIGRIIAATLAAEGATVVVSGRTVARGEEVVANIRKAGGEARFVPVDIGDEDDVRSLVQATVDAYGSLDVVVNNAASTDLLNNEDAAVADVTLEAWERVLRVTLTGTMLVSKHALPHMIATGGGAIVNISSGASHVPDPDLAAYSAAKAGMNSLTRSIAVKYGRQGVRANTIVTGMILPPQSLPLFEQDPAVWQRLTTQHATGSRLGRREDIAAGVVYLASDDAGFVTGTELHIDGGSAVMSNLITKEEIFGAGS